MKTIERLDFPIFLYVMFQDEPRRHESAVIVFTHDAPAYVRASSPFAIYPWENIKHIIRVADESQGDGLMGKHKVLREENIRLHKLHTDKRLALRKALGLNDDEDLDHAALCERVAMMREWRDSAGHPAVAQAARLQLDLASMTEQRDLLKRQLEELRSDMNTLKAGKRAVVAYGINKGESVEVVETNGSYVLVRFDNGNEVSCPSSWIETHPGSTAHSPSGTTSGTDPDHRDSYRGTALRAGAKDCTLFVGPKPSDITFVVEMREGSKVFDVVAALEHEHGLQPEAYRIREVRAPMP